MTKKLIIIPIGGGILPFVKVIERVRDAGREPATPADARRIYGIGDGRAR